MTDDELEMLIGYGEDSRLDRKRDLRLDTPWHRAEFVKDIMAFANGHEDRPAHILIGVDDGGGLHDAGATLPDEATLQQIVASHLDPPVAFSLRRRTLQGVVLGVIEVPPSTERFHVAARDVQEAGGKLLLRQGELLIRRGTAKMPPKALDFKLLKEAHARSHAPQAWLDVCFAGESPEVQTVRGWPMPGRVLQQVLAHVVVPPGSGRFDWRYQFVPLRFFIHNRGSAQAEAVIIEIDLPADCQAVFAPADDRNPRGWAVAVNRAANRVRIEGERLVHGDHRWSRDVYVRFFRREWRYALEWTARAGNVAAPTRGTLHVEILPCSP